MSGSSGPCRYDSGGRPVRPFGQVCVKLKYGDTDFRKAHRYVDGKVLCMNILSSDYFKELYRMKTYHEVIGEIYNQVDHVEPWMTGNCRFFTMKLTVKQMHGLLKHPDSPYIRAIGFLYLRYVADPKILWTWYEPYLKDDEEFSPGSNGRMTTMGVFVVILYLDSTTLIVSFQEFLFSSSTVTEILAFQAVTESVIMTVTAGIVTITGSGIQKKKGITEANMTIVDTGGSSSCHRSRSGRSRSRSRNEHRSSPFGDTSKEKAAAASSNLAKLKDLSGGVAEKKDDGDARRLHHDSCAEEVIRLGGPRWR
ncbi:hypothetical protein ZWY2020_058535 [Hordeum vulgare]|nr:hypothetical protein ZWY2020_058535 [Hordeum vulgare]